MKKCLLLLIVLILWSPMSHAGVVINEVFANGQPDWIELYNTDNESKNLAGYFLSDNASNTTKWVFPSNTQIPANGYLMIYAGGDNPDYIVENALMANFKISQKDNEIWLYSPQHEMVDHAGPVDTSIYGNRSVSFGRLKDGQGNWGIIKLPSPGKNNEEKVFIQDPLQFNEIMRFNTHSILSAFLNPLDDRAGYYGYVEIKNNSSQTLDLSGYAIDYEDDSWYFPKGLTLLPEQVMIIFASGQNEVIENGLSKEVHAPFILTEGGNKQLTLLNSQGQAIDGVYLGDMKNDQSIGRLTSVDWVNLSAPTPNRDNREANIDVSNIVLNEVASAENQDWIELYNKSDKTLSLAGAFLSDDQSRPQKWQFPVGASIDPKGHVVIYASDLNTVATDDAGNITAMHTNFSISKDGKEPVIFTSNDGSYQDVVNKGLLTMIAHESLARIPDGTNNWQKVISPTLGFNNRQDIFKPDAHAQDIIINEVMVDNDSNLGLDNPQADMKNKDWIEIYNKGQFPVQIGGLMLQVKDAIWPLPQRILEPGTYLTIFPSFTMNHSESFTLSLLNGDRSILNQVILPALGHDVAYARVPDGLGEFKSSVTPTPNFANRYSPLERDTRIAENLRISEIMTFNVNNLNLSDLKAHPSVDKQDWIEIYNQGNEALDLYQVALKDQGTVWFFDKNTIIQPKQFMLVYAMGPDFNNLDKNILSANFALDRDGERLQLLNKDGSIIQDIVVPAVKSDESFALDLPTGLFHLEAWPTPLVLNQTAPVVANAENIVINEVMTSNESNVGLDVQNLNDIDQKDWIEIYNKGLEPVQLEGLKIANDQIAWVFPNKVLNPREFLLIYASAKDIKNDPRQWHANFTLSSKKNNVLRLLDKGNRDIQKPIIIPALAMDTTWAAAHDGQQDFAIQTKATPGKANAPSTISVNEEAKALIIHEVMVDNQNDVGLDMVTYSSGHHQAWIEIFNSGSREVELKGLRISDKNDNTWIMPQGKLGPNQFKLIFASGRDFGDPVWHADFKLSSTPSVGQTEVERLTLWNLDQSIIDQVSVPPLSPDQSFGVWPNAQRLDRRILNKPTPGALNDDLEVSPNDDAKALWINEVQTDNKTNPPDQDHLGQDWIELYNPLDRSINMEGLKLKDKSGQTWIFPQIQLSGHDFLLVYASGHSQTQQPLSTSFALSSTEGDELTLLNRDNSAIAHVTLPPMGPDQSYVRLEDGKRYAITLKPTPRMINQEIPLPANEAAKQIIISEIMPENLLDSGLNLALYPSGHQEDWIEIYNQGTTEVNLTGLKLRDNNGALWEMPQATLPPNTYRLIFASGKNINQNIWHTNFKLSSSQGGRLSLLNTDYSLIDEVNWTTVNSDISLVRIQAKSPRWVMTQKPTPGYAHALVKFSFKVMGDVDQAFIGLSPQGDFCPPDAQFPFCYQYPQGTTLNMRVSNLTPIHDVPTWSWATCGTSSQCEVILEGTLTTGSVYVPKRAQILPALPSPLQSNQMVISADPGVLMDRFQLQVYEDAKLIYDSKVTSSPQFNLSALPNQGENLSFQLYSRQAFNGQWLKPIIYHTQAMIGKGNDGQVKRDLSIEGVTVSTSTGKTGAWFLSEDKILTVNVKNKGQELSQAVNIDLFIDGRLTDTRQLKMESLKPNENQRLIKVIPSDLSVGRHQIRLVLDSNNFNIDEVRSNNVYVANIEVLADLLPPRIISQKVIKKEVKGKKRLELYVETDEPAECRLSSQKGVDFDRMPYRMEVMGQNQYRWISKSIRHFPDDFNLRCQDKHLNRHQKDIVVTIGESDKMVE